MAFKFACGFECGLSGSGLSNVHWTDFSANANLNTTTKRAPGARSVRINPTASINGSVQSTGLGALGNGTTWCMRVYFRVASHPTANSAVASFYTTTGGQAIGLFYDSSSSTYKLGGYSSLGTALASTGVSLSTGQWYRLDLKVVHANASTTVDGFIDGVALTQANTNATGVTYTLIRLGVTTGASSTFDIYYDDVLMGDTATDYPYGAGHTDLYVPVADGTHNIAGTGDFQRGNTAVDILNATTTAYQLIDDVPLPPTASATDSILGLAPANPTTDYVECIFGPAPGFSNPTAGPRIIDVLCAHHQAATTTGQMQVLINDNGTTDIMFDTGAAAGVTTIRYGRKAYVDPPSAATVWHALNDGSNGDIRDLRMRFLAQDANPDQSLDAVMFEAEFLDSSGTPFTQTLTGGMTPDGALVRLTSQNKAGAATPAGALKKAIANFKAGAATPGGTLAKLAGKKLAGSAGTPTGALLAVKGKQFTGAITPGGTIRLVRASTQIKSGAITPGGLLAKLVAVRKTGGLTPSGILATLKYIPKALAGAITPTGTIKKQVTQIKTGGLTPAGLLVKQIAHTKTGGLTPSGILTTLKYIPKLLTGAITPTGIIKKLVDKKTAGAVTPTGAVAKLVAKAFAGTAATAGALRKAPAKALAGIAATVGALQRKTTLLKQGTVTTVGSLASPGINTATLSGGITPSGILTRRLTLFRNILGGLLPAGAVTRIASKFKTLTGTATPTGLIRYAIARRFTGIVTFAGTLRKNVAKYLSGFLNPAGTLATLLHLGGYEAGQLEVKVFSGTELYTEMLGNLEVTVKLASDEYTEML